MMYVQWLIILIPAFLIELLAWLVTPIVALFVKNSEEKITSSSIDAPMIREQLQHYVYWFQTHDNPVDEYWYGGYYKESFFPYVKKMTQEKYDDSKVARYVMRMLWMFRNTAYGIHYAIFSKPERGTPIKVYSHGVFRQDRFWYFLKIYENNSFHFKGHLPLLPIIKGSNIFNDFNLGWKAHKEVEKCLYANRIIGIRVRKV